MIEALEKFMKGALAISTTSVAPECYFWAKNNNKEMVRSRLTLSKQLAFCISKIHNLLLLKEVLGISERIWDCEAKDFLDDSLNFNGVQRLNLLR